MKKTFNKEELLKEAIRRFPEGTKFRNNNLKPFCVGEYIIMALDFKVMKEKEGFEVTAQYCNKGCYTIYTEKLGWAKKIYDSKNEKDI